MIDVKQAAQSAEAFVRAIYPEGQLQNLRVEEIDRSDDGSSWEITLGWVDLDAPVVAAFLDLNRTRPRVYKTLRVDAESGKVASMKIRSVA